MSHPLLAKSPLLQQLAYESNMSLYSPVTDKEGSMDRISPAKGGADEGVLGIVKEIFMVVGLGERTIVIRDGEWLTGGGNPSLSWVGVELQLLFLLLLVLCEISSLLLLLLFLLLLLTDACVFELEVLQCLLNVIGAGVL